MSSNKITSWYVKRPDGLFQFNHIADGHGHGIKPEPKSERQQVWNAQTWAKRETEMVDKVVK
jgi:hypothetical protein